MGAKGKYAKWLLPDNLLRLQAWARDGLSNEQIAHNIGINQDTLYTWIKKYPEFSEALSRGKEVVAFHAYHILCLLSCLVFCAAAIFLRIKTQKIKR